MALATVADKHYDETIVTVIAVTPIADTHYEV
jgi:hypothetical protein